MFRACKVALGDDEDKDVREWELRLAKLRKRQRKKKKDDALVASFFNHVEDPVAIHIAELLMDCSMECPSRCDTESSNCENGSNGKQEMLTMATAENDETEHQEISSYLEQNELVCVPVENDSDGGDQTCSLTDDIMDSEPTPMLPTILETDSERTIKTGFLSAPSSSPQSSDYQSDLSPRTGVKSAIMESLARNVWQMLPAGKENVVDEERPESSKTGEPNRSSLHNLSKIRRSPLHESKPKVLISRQQQSLALNSF